MSTNKLSEWEQGFLCDAHSKKFCSKCEPRVIQWSTNFQWRGKPVKKEVTNKKGDKVWWNFYNEKYVDLGNQWFNGETTTEEMFEAISVTGLPIGPVLIENENGNRSIQSFKSHQVALVDIDDGMTIEQLDSNDFYREYAAGYYTSPSHKEEAHRFRIIFVLEQPIETELRMRQLYTSLIAKFGGDTSCKDASRLFFGTVNAQRSEWRADKCLPVEIVEELLQQSNIEEKKQGDLPDPNYELPSDEQKRVYIELLYQVGRLEYNDWRMVCCVFKENDFSFEDFVEVTTSSIKPSYNRSKCKQAWDGVKGSAKGYTIGSLRYLIQQKLGSDISFGVETPRETDFDAIKQFVKEHKPVSVISVEENKLTKKEIFESIFGVLEDAPVEPYDMDKRKQMLVKYCVSKDYKVMLLYAFEGFGKSYYAVLEVNQGKKVIFACESNIQAVEQAEGFRKAGLRVQVITGRKYNLMKVYGIEAEVSDDSAPFVGGDINEAATKSKMMLELKKTSIEVDQIWADLAAVKPDFVNHDIIVTTMSRTLSWGHIQRTKKRWDPETNRSVLKDGDRIVPTDTIIFFDDCSFDQVTPYAEYKEKFKDRKQPNSSAKYVVEEWHGRKYFVRPASMWLGYGLFDTKLVFTTTEGMVGGLINKYYKDVYIPKLMPNQKMLVGDITMISTNVVRAKSDGFIPCIVQRLKNEKFNFEYIANGVGATHNLTNSKGKNSFTEADVLIEISEPPMPKVLKYMDALHWGPEDSFAVRCRISSDWTPLISFEWDHPISG